MKRQSTIGFWLVVVGSLVVHVVVLGCVVWGWRGQVVRSRMKDEVLVTKWVKLGRPRPKKLLPRKPQAAIQQAPKVKLASPSIKPKAKTKPPVKKKRRRVRTKKRKKKIAKQPQVKMTDALQRLKSLKGVKEPIGSRTGVAGGELSALEQSLQGSRMATELYHCIKSHYTVEGLSVGELTGFEAKVLVHVLANGALVQVKLERGSGMPLFDRAVLKAAQLCKQVSPPPVALRRRARRDGFEITFRP